MAHFDNRNEAFANAAFEAAAIERARIAAVLAPVARATVRRAAAKAPKRGSLLSTLAIVATGLFAASGAIAAVIHIAA